MYIYLLLLNFMTIHGEIQFYQAINAWRSEPPYLNFIPDSQ
jgi:hypothetical protein